ncbi:PCNA-associated factor-like [Ostrinia furnacalis]|uniref:PCNA-associated factor-like n=1 Tax=Ostrinia furnacalis TaxID=93504 RepID=UPI00103A0911|nr:PCNA-associated factor-like [Ostrinia furnacalis]
MARTKASVGAKVASGKSSKARCSVAPLASSSGGSGSGDKASRSGSGGGNSVCHRETPKWQKPITNFFICKDNSRTKNDSDTEECDEAAAGSSKPKPKRNVIESEDEDETERPTNNVLDETIELEPLTGENSHKIDEYYNKNSKGKGVGKKTKGKENIDANTEKRNSVKRELEELTLEEESLPATKKMKVN